MSYFTGLCMVNLKQDVQLEFLYKSVSWWLIQSRLNILMVVSNDNRVSMVITDSISLLDTWAFVIRMLAYSELCLSILFVCNMLLNNCSLRILYLNVLLWRNTDYMAINYLFYNSLKKIAKKMLEILVQTHVNFFS